MFSLSFSLLGWEFILQSLFGVFSSIHFSHFVLIPNWKQCSQSQKPIEELKNCSSEMLVCLLYLIFVVLLLWCRCNEKAGQTHPKICILFSRHDTSLLIYGIQATWGCNMVLPYHMVCFISYCFILFQVLMFHLVIVILAFLHLCFTIKVSLCVITRCFGTRLQWIKYNSDLPWSIKISKF
jgi:hypothetical protein